jgi:hypothetical protein
LQAATYICAIYLAHTLFNRGFSVIDTRGFKRTLTAAIVFKNWVPRQPAQNLLFSASIHGYFQVARR